MKNKLTNSFKKILALVLVLSVCGTFVACGASSAPIDSDRKEHLSLDSAANSAGGFFDMTWEPEFAPEADYAPESPMATDKTDKETSDTDDYLSSQKLIYTCNIELESLEFAETQKKIQELIQQNGGFIESNRLYDDAYGWYYSSYEKTTGTLRQELTVRIPSENYHTFVNGVTTIGKVQHKSEDVQNITTQYNDTETTIKSLKTQEKRLLEMLAACNSVEDMITVERRLSEVQMQLERYQTQLNRYDADIKFSTVNISLEEVREYSPTYEEKNFFQRFKEHLDTTIEDFADFMEGALFVIIYLFPYSLVIIAIVLIVRKIIKKRKIKKTAPSLVRPVEGSTEHTNLTSEAGQTKDISVQTEVGAKKKDKK